MRVLNNININFELEHRVYELTIECNNESEVDTAFDKLSDSFTVENFDDNDVTVIAQADSYYTKQDFIKEVKQLLRK